MLKWRRKVCRLMLTRRVSILRVGYGEMDTGKREDGRSAISLLRFGYVTHITHFISMV